MNFYNLNNIFKSKEEEVLEIDGIGPKIDAPRFTGHRAPANDGDKTSNVGRACIGNK